MAQVCNWLSIFACMRGTSSKSRIQHQIHPGRPGHFDAVIVWKGKETQKANTGGVAYEVILKPAAADVPRPSSPPKDKGITHDDIVKKLQEAEERRLSMEAAKLESVAKGKERAQQAHVKVQEEVENKTRVTQEKIRRSMEVNKENREAQIQALQGRLRDHEKKIEEVRKNKTQLKNEDENGEGEGEGSNE